MHGIGLTWLACSAVFQPLTGKIYMNFKPKVRKPVIYHACIFFFSEYVFFLPIKPH
jgi:hypothetical protein